MTREAKRSAVLTTGRARQRDVRRAIARALAAWRADVVAAEVERAPAEARLLLRLEAEALAECVRAGLGAGPTATLAEEPPSAALVRVGHVLSFRAGLLDALAFELPASVRARLLLAAGRAIDGRLTWLTRAAAEETAALGETLLSLRALFENLRDGLIFVDRRGLVQDLNRSAVEHRGLAREAIVGRPFHEIWPSPAERPFEPLYARVLETGVTETLYDVEYEPPRAERAIVFDLVVARRIVAGETAGTVTIVHYRTEQKELEQELRHSEKMASIGQLATGIAHELKNLLAGIRGYAEIGLGSLAARWPPSGVAGRAPPRVLDKILAVTERARRLTEGLLSFARKGRPRVEPVDLAKLLDLTLELGLSKKDRRGINPALKIVVVTGQALGDEALAKVRALTDGYVEKPFPVAAILEAAERVLVR